MCVFFTLSEYYILLHNTFILSEPPKINNIPTKKAPSMEDVRVEKGKATKQASEQVTMWG